MSEADGPSPNEDALRELRQRLDALQVNPERLADWLEEQGDLETARHALRAQLDEIAQGHPELTPDRRDQLVRLMEQLQETEHGEAEGQEDASADQEGSGPTPQG